MEPDYQALGGANRDKFEVHLRNVLNENFGTAFVTSRVTIKFHSAEDKDVCEVETAPANTPVFVTVRDKNGQSAEKFYARSGNSSQELSPSETAAYIKDRFHS